MKKQTIWGIFLVVGLFTAACVQRSDKRNLREIADSPSDQLSVPNEPSFAVLAEKVKESAQVYLSERASEGTSDSFTIKTLDESAKNITEMKSSDLASLMEGDGIDSLATDLLEEQGYDLDLEDLSAGLIITGGGLVAVFGLVHTVSYSKDQSYFRPELEFFERLNKVKAAQLNFEQVKVEKLKDLGWVDQNNKFLVLDQKNIDSKYKIFAEKYNIKGGETFLDVQKNLLKTSKRASRDYDQFRESVLGSEYMSNDGKYMTLQDVEEKGGVNNQKIEKYKKFLVDHNIQPGSFVRVSDLKKNKGIPEFDSFIRSKKLYSAGKIISILGFNAGVGVYAAGRVVEELSLADGSSSNAIKRWLKRNSDIEDQLWLLRAD